MPTSPTPITALPTAPSRADPANFPARADAFLGALGTFGTQLNAVATNTFDNATEAEADATAAEASRVAAAASQTAAAASASAASGSASAAASSATSASGSASTATTQATNAGNSATAAAASQTAAASSATAAAASQTAAAGSAATSTTQAAASAISATNAAASASNAATSASAASGSASSASSSATAAAASALSAVNAPGTSGTSTTSLTIGTGSRTFTTQTGKAWVVGQFVLISNSAAPANWMIGYISAYNSGTGAMTVEAQNTNGSGTAATWNISLAAPTSDDDLNAQVIMHLQHALDLAGVAARRVVAADVAGTAHEEVLIRHINHLADLVGVVARAISGGDIILRRGTVGDPSLHIDGDPDTGLWSPGPDQLALSVGGVQAVRITADRRLGLGDNNNTPTGILDVGDDKIRVRTAKTPATAGAAGNQGEIAWDASYVYVCTATNTWKRAAIATW